MAVNNDNLLILLTIISYMVLHSWIFKDIFDVSWTMGITISISMGVVTLGGAVLVFIAFKLLYKWLHVETRRK